MATSDIKKVIQEKLAANLVTIAIGGTVAYIIYKKFILKDEVKRGKEETKNIDSELDAAKKRKPLSYPLSQYATFCNVIVTATQDAGTDENAIYAVFKKIKSNSDYLQLLKSWGNPTRQVYPDWIFFYSTGYKLTLPQLIRFDMDSKEVEKINNILAGNGVTYRI
jgi:hypothetical protein